MTHSQEATTASMTAAATTSAATSATTASTPSAATSAATSATTSEATTTSATMGPLNAGVGDQALLLHIKDQDIKIAKLEALLEHEISEVKVLVEHQNTKFSEMKVLVEHQNTKLSEENAKFSKENAKFSEVNAKFSAENVKFAEVETKFYILESEIKRLTRSQAATTSSPQTTTSSPQTTTSSPQTTTSSPQTTTSSPQTTTSSTIDTSAGVVFTRWGRSDCPAGISAPVYNGTVGGSYYNHTGAAVNHLCMPNDPTWDVNKLFTSTTAGYVYGGVYINLPDSSLNYYVSPCAVCRAALFSTKVVIPGRNTCYPGWTKAYSGELTSGYYISKAATEYSCLDRQPQKVVHSGTVGFWMYPVLAKCGALPCPPYHDEAPLTCVVCLK